jgi:hypothetical protein
MNTNTDANTSAPRTTAAVVRELQSADEDWEWYPTTSAMLDVIREDLRLEYGDRHCDDGGYPSVDILDVGAGDGRALMALAGHGRKLSIEKASTLVRLQPDEVIPVGWDFHRSTLIDKACEVVVTNPPYAEFSVWAERIIREANAAFVYLILPVRWKDQPGIQRALERRQATTSVLLTSDFINAERAARCRIDIVKVALAGRSGAGRYRRRGEQCAVDPFVLWFEQTFPKPEAKDDEAAGEATDGASRLHERVSHEMVQGRSLIEALCRLHDKELADLAGNYRAATELDPALMKEIGITHEKLLASLKERIGGLKHSYWQELFANYESITANLTTKSRDTMLRALHANTAVEFSEDNAVAITMWVLKNANTFVDRQLIEVCERMISRANIHLYKSNTRVYGNDDWRYNRWRHSEDRPAPEKVALDYRIVLEDMGGICTSEWTWERTKNAGLETHAAEFLQDILAVASTLGWSVASGRHGVTSGRNWASNQLETFYVTSGRKLMDVRAFKNGNLHVRFHQDFIRKLNVEFGRLKGWLKSTQDAVDELGITPQEAEEDFGSALNVLPERAARKLLGIQAEQASAA